MDVTISPGNFIIYTMSEHQYLYFFQVLILYINIESSGNVWNLKNKVLKINNNKQQGNKKKRHEKKIHTLLHHLHLNSYNQQTQIATTTWENFSPTFFSITPSQSYFELLHFKPKNINWKKRKKNHTSEINDILLYINSFYSSLWQCKFSPFTPGD